MTKRPYSERQGVFGREKGLFKATQGLGSSVNGSTAVGGVNVSNVGGDVILSVLVGLLVVVGVGVDGRRMMLLLCRWLPGIAIVNINPRRSPLSSVT